MSLLHLNVHIEEHKLAIIKKYSFLFLSVSIMQWNGRTILPFLFRPYFLLALPSQTVFDFLTQWHNKLCHFDFISDMMDYFLAGKDQQQTNQLND